MNAVVIIPARNEEECIGGVVAGIREHFAGLIVVVDNGSSDATAERATRAGAHVVKAAVAGYGRACAVGASAAGHAEALVFMDGDGSDCPGDIPALLAALENGADLALGVRRGPRVEAGSIAPAARFGNWLSCSIIGLFTGTRPGDLSPLKAIRRTVLESLRPAEETYGWTVELLALAASRNLTIAEVETGYRHRAGGQSKVSGTVAGGVRAGSRILLVLGRVAMRQLTPRPIGAIAGAGLGIVGLVVFSAWLWVQAPSGEDVLVASWLLAWPVVLGSIGLGALAGALLGSMRRGPG